MSAFFPFRQNNTGGSFDFMESEGITVNVVIEAQDATDANVTAIHKGLYFDGCSRGQDCSCCGDRWYRFSEDDTGDVVPSIYSEPLGQVKTKSEFAIFDRAWMRPGRETAVHYADGRIEWFNADNTKAEQQ